VRAVWRRKNAVGEGEVALSCHLSCFLGSEVLGEGWWWWCPVFFYYVDRV
jgi:hypothetical protein